jgi:hypothetical protein
LQPVRDHFNSNNEAKVLLEAVKVNLFFIVLVHDPIFSLESQCKTDYSYHAYPSFLIDLDLLAQLH